MVMCVLGKDDNRVRFPVLAPILGSLVIFIHMTKSELREIINECVQEVLRENEDGVTDFLERRDNILYEVVRDFLAGRKHIYWPVIKAEKLAKVWLLYGKYGRIDEKDIDDIADKMIDLVARLTVSTELSGHTPYDVREELEDNGYEFTEEEWGRLLDTLEDKDGRWYLSDYGLKPLQNLALRLYNANNAEQKLFTVDRMLNVVHQRSDLAAMFVQGGTRTLNKIASQGGYSTGFDGFSDKANQQQTY